MIQALIFDVDGTLAETEELHRKAFNETFAANGVGWDWSVADYTRLLKTTGGKERMRAYCGEIDADLSDEKIAALHQDKTARYANLVAAGGLTLRPGIAGLVEGGRAQGLGLAVATTTSRANVDALCRTCWGQPAAAVFDVIAAGDEVAAKKPAPDVYLLALERMGLKPEQAIAFEDTRNGMLSARAAGLLVCISPTVYSADDDFS